jgi:hypothetical protein
MNAKSRLTVLKRASTRIVTRESFTQEHVRNLTGPTVPLVETSF